MQRLIAAAAVLVIAGMACAQQPEVFGSHIDIAFSWTEVNPVGTPNNILEPGEGARISMTLTMTPASGSPVTWNPNIGGSGSGELRAIYSAFVDLVGTASAQGDWTELQVDLAWEVGLSWGTPIMGGTRVNNIGAAQLPVIQAFVNLTNPVIDIWHGTWTPASYAPRAVTFQSENATSNPDPLGAGVIVRDPLAPNAVFVGTSALTYGSVTIPIIPAPPSAAILGLGCLVASRRSRLPLDLPCGRSGAIR